MPEYRFDTIQHQKKKMTTSRVTFFRARIYAILTAIFAICLFSGRTQAQYSEFGLGLGFSTYWGDLNAPSVTNNLLNCSGLAIQGHYRRMMGDNLGFRVSLGYGRIRAKDSNSDQEWQKIRNLSFKSPVIDLSLTGEYYPFGFNPEPGYSIIAPYISAGLSAFRFDPSTEYQGNSIRLQPLGTEGQGLPGFPAKYSLTNFGLAFGGGTKIILTETLNIGLEVLMRRTFTDYMDDISTIYVNYDDLSAGNGTLAANLSNRMNEYLGQEEPVQLATGSVRGSAKVKDYYMFSMVSLNFILTDRKGKKRFGKSKVVCPTF